MITWFDIFTFLQGITPPIIIFLTAYLLIRSFLRNDAKRRALEIEKQSTHKLIDLKLQLRKELIPIRLQAYERLLLFLERNRLPSLYLRLRKANMAPGMLQAAMVRSVREEFEHNLSQQLYVSPEAWKLLLMAKDSLLDIITSNAPFDFEDSISYGGRLIDIYASSNSNEVDAASAALVKEVETIFF